MGVKARIGWRRRLAAIAAAGLLLGTSVPAPIAAAPPGGLSISPSAICRVRDGGHRGFAINWEWTWSYPDTGALGPDVTISGEYSLQIHNPATDRFEALFTFPYGYNLPLDSSEVRQGRESTNDPHWIFEKARMVTSWKIESSGETGTDVLEVPCTVLPPPPGQEPIRATPATESSRPAEAEVFVHTADPSPYANLSVESWLLCGERNDGRSGLLSTWGFSATNRGLESDGATVSGVARYSTRTDQGEYTLAQEVPFARYIASNETTYVDGYLERPSRLLAAVRLEVEWKVSLGTQVDPAASTQRILRTSSCRS